MATSTPPRSGPGGPRPSWSSSPPTAPSPEITPARWLGPRGVAFFGIDPTPRAVPAEMARRWSDWHLPFPILFDSKRRVVRQAGVAVTPEAVVILPDGQVVYRGRIDDRYRPDGQKLPAAGRS